MAPLAVLATVYLDTQVRSKFEGRKWAIPAKVYARPMEIYPAQALPREAFLRALDVLGYRAGNTADKPGHYSLEDGAISFMSRGFAFADQREVSQRFRVLFNNAGIADIRDNQGQAIPLVRLEPLLIGSLYPGEHEDRLLIQLQEMPPVMLAGLVAVEDRYFMDHHGFSWRGVLRAMVTNLSAGGLVQGGSTITQQLVKNFYLTSERTLTRKITEVWMALLLEYHYDKKTILETYLNEVYLGQEGNRAIHGFGLASQYYFRQPLAELKLHQMAMMIGMVKGPSYYDPWRHPDRCRERRQVVLDVMRDQGIISQAERDWATAQTLGVGSAGNSRPGVYPAFLEMVRRQLKSDYRDEDLLSEGLQVFTTVDPLVQQVAEQQLRDGIEKIEKTYAKKMAAGKLQGAVVITNPANGEVLAAVGDRQPQYVGFNRALDARRPVGSLLKPFVFMAALESQRYSLASMVDDGPVKWRSGNGRWWQPRNYDHENHGTVSILDTLAHSYNQATARVGLQLGADTLLDLIRKAGVHAPLDAVPALILGAGGMTPMEVAALYQILPADGFVLPLRAIREVYTADGKPVKRYGLDMEKRFDTATVQLTSWAMRAVIREGTAKAAYSAFPFGMTLAGKTGTTDDMRDSWFGGFSSNFNTVVWVGRDDNGTTPLSGATGALPIWTGIMSHLPNQALPEPSDEHIGWQWIDRASGARTDEACTGSRRLPLDTRGPQPPYIACGGKGSWLQDFIKQ